MAFEIVSFLIITRSISPVPHAAATTAVAMDGGAAHTGPEFEKTFKTSIGPFILASEKSKGGTLLCRKFFLSPIALKFHVSNP